MALPTQPPDVCGFGPVPASLLATAWGAKWLAVKDKTVAMRYPSDPVRAVDRWVNYRLGYRFDNIDEWAEPAVTLQRGYGDCEDFALLKRAILLRSGIPEACIHLLICRDLVVADVHAMLLVQDRGQWLNLDSRSNATLPVDRLTEYVPIAAYSGTSCWAYGKRR